MIPAAFDYARASSVEEASKKLRIGALTRHVAIQNSQVVKDKLPLLAEVAGEVGDNQVRNMGTMGGVIAHADAAGDYPTLALMLDADVVTNRRTIPAREFFKDLFTPRSCSRSRTGRTST